MSSSLGAIRDHIDAVDSELVKLLATRLTLVVAAAGYKSDLASVADPIRVNRVLEGVRSQAARCGADLDAVDAIFRIIIGQGIELERRAYKGAGTQEAAASLGGDIGMAGALAGVASSHLTSIMATMRAMRRLDDRPVPAHLLEKLVKAASWAPVGANRQRYRFVIVTDRSRMARLAPHWAKAMEFYLGALRPPVPPEDWPQQERVHAAMAYQRQHFERIPALVVVCYEPVSFWKRLSRDPRRAFRQLAALKRLDRVRVLSNLRRWANLASAASVYPAVENLLLAARAYGLGATLTTWHSAFEKDFKAVLEIPRGVDIYAIVPIGYPLGRFGPVRRRPVKQLISEQKWRASDD